jgi:hypothetical protein
VPVGCSLPRSSNSSPTNTTHHFLSRVGTAADDEIDTVEGPNTTWKTPFQIFQDHTLARIAESEILVVNELDTNINVQDVMQPIVTWKEL